MKLLKQKVKLQQILNVNICTANHNQQFMFNELFPISVSGSVTFLTNFVNFKIFYSRGKNYRMYMDLHQVIECSENNKLQHCSILKTESRSKIIWLTWKKITSNVSLFINNSNIVNIAFQ